jgi:glycosyltransferase involved in cell wall biosynthesis
MLDTIAWDIVYPCHELVETTWRILARHSDALLFISDFTRKRFDFRFPVAPHVLQSVALLSLDERDYTNPTVVGAPVEKYIFVIGNDYDHKAVAPTIDALGRAFPFDDLLCVGAALPGHENLRTVSSGNIPDNELDRMFASAWVVVFPSYYEGFGLPVLKALAYGRTVLVRESPLWHELAAQTRAEGRLATFRTTQELVELVGSLRGGRDIPTLKLGSGLQPGAVPPAWRDCAARIIEAVEKAERTASVQTWLDRECALAPFR